METKKATWKQIAAILLLAAGVIFTVFGVLGPCGRKQHDPL